MGVCSPQYVTISSGEILTAEELLTRLSTEFAEEFDDLTQAFVWLEQFHKHETICDIWLLNEFLEEEFQDEEDDELRLLQEKLKKQCRDVKSNGNN